jgi:hypothetical protein
MSHHPPEMHATPGHLVELTWVSARTLPHLYVPYLAVEA